MCNSFGRQKVHLLYFYNLCLWIRLKNWHSVSRKISGCIFVYADLFLCLHPLKLIHWVMWYIFYISDKTLSMSNVPVKVIKITSRSTNTNLRGGAGTQITKKVCLSHLNDLKHVNITFPFFIIVGIIILSHRFPFPFPPFKPSMYPFPCSFSNPWLLFL